MKIGVIGIGMVGNAIQQAFKDINHQVSIYDIKIPESKFDDVLDSEVIFICVPTKQQDDGSCDLSVVFEVVSSINAKNYKGVVAIKSTVEPGTTQKLQALYPDLTLAHVPEFLRERCGYEDFTENHNVLIIGTDDQRAYNTIVKSHGNFPKNIIHVSSNESELAKYYSNTFKALKTIFSTSFGRVCDHVGADYNKVLEAFLLENVQTREYLGYSEEFQGFGGSCLPKDVSALNHYVHKNDLDLDIFNFTILENLKF